MNGADNALLAAHIDELLPQTQCTRCGFPTCRDYAEAIAGGAADIDRCPPGGADGVAALAHLLGVATKPLDPAYGIEAPQIVALIDEDVCIGCTKCIQACPVDAIVGAAKRMHTVIAAECTGCELCLPPCPVDCIALVPIAAAPLSRTEVLQRAVVARARFEARIARLGQAASTGSIVGAAEAAMLLPGRDKSSTTVTNESIATSAAPTKDLPTAAPPITRSAVLAAIARGKARRAKDADGS